MDFDKVLFDDKKFSDILRDIYKNREEKDFRITELINELTPLIKKPNDAILLVPLLKEYMEVAVKNDEHIVKMAAIVQRAMSRQISSQDDFQMTEEEINELYESYQHETNEKLDKTLKKTDKIIGEIDGIKELES